ncbi:MAG: T9SS type A sorting domain-containing protein [Chitinophagaceae bacterium]
MKKFLLTFAIIALTAAAQQSYGQTVCGSGFIYHWTGNGGSGDQGAGPAPILINGTSTDWEAAITGPFAYSAATSGGLETNPYTSPVAPANAQKDGLKAAVPGPDFDRDCPGATHRDLRYFAFTYDLKNVYFIFRRPANNTAQVSLYYFIDLNVDGFMAQGEPVIKVTFNNSGSDIEMGYYHPVNSNGTAAGSYDAVKGNIMTASVARAQNCPGTSQWTVGAADGWSMPGDFEKLGNNVNLPALAPGEVFSAATLNDTHPDATVTGYGVEFAVPWQYFGKYTASGLTAGTAINSNNVFTWHVSLGSGNSGVSGAEDNAGGCCSGLAFSGNANSVLFQPISVTETIWQQKFRMGLSYTENVGYTTNVIMTSVKISFTQFGPTPPDPTTDYTVTVFPADAGGNPVGAGTAFVYSTQAAGVYTFVGSPVIVSTVTAGGTAKFVVDVDFGPLKRTKSASITYTTSNEFAVASTNCSQSGSTVNNGVNVITLTLPVTFSSFTATRSTSSITNVLVRWSTATEVNNSGFAVERNINGTWEQVAFVPTQATNGNSTAGLDYQFIDNNNSKGITQYRIRQIDIDGKARNSEIRAVRGISQLGGVIVYPNPSTDGKVNIVFEDANVARDISVIDMSGRTVKQVRGVTNNNITIENLKPGMYTLRMLVPTTGDQTVQKIVVQ